VFVREFTVINIKNYRCMEIFHHSDVPKIKYINSNLNHLPRQRLLTRSVQFELAPGLPAACFKAYSQGVAASRQQCLHH
jgi:hypothetical protein